MHGRRGVWRCDWVRGRSTQERTIDEITILLVEDEETVRRVTGRLLTKLGYTVFTSADAEEAFEVFRARGDDIALVLTDLVMPGLTGVDIVAVLWE